MINNDNTIFRIIAKISAATSRFISGGNLLTITKKYKCQIAPNTGYLIMKPRMSQVTNVQFKPFEIPETLKLTF